MSQYKPKKRSSSFSDQELLDVLVSLSKRLKKDKITMADLEKYTDFNRGLYKRRFGTWNETIIKAGLNPSKLISVTDEQILGDLQIIHNSLGRLPTKEEYNDKGTFSSALIQRRFGGFHKAYEKLDAFVNKFGEKELLKYSKPTLGKLKPLQPKKKREVLGEPIKFREMLNAPINELGVVLLFGLVAKDLGFIIDGVKQGFPDCIARRRMGNTRKYQQVSIEFEFESKNFKQHKHNPNECDIIVCWKHNWAGCPSDIEVIELEEEIKALNP